MNNYPYSQYEDAVLGVGGLLGYWRQGEPSGSVATDTAAGADASYLGGVSLGVPGGLVGDPATAASFNGSNGQAVVGKTFVGPGMALTVECLVNLSGSNNHGIFFRTGDAGTGVAFGMGTSGLTGLQSNGLNMLAVYDTIGAVQGPSLSGLSGWNHLGYTIGDNGRAVDFFINGIHQGGNSAGRTMVAPTGQSYIGGFTSSFYNRALQEVAVYGRALDQAVFAQHVRVMQALEQRPHSNEERRYVVKADPFFGEYGGGTYGHGTYGAQSAGVSLSGTVSVGPLAKALDLSTVAVTGGYVTADPYVQGSLRGIGLFEEVAV